MKKIWPWLLLLLLLIFFCVWSKKDSIHLSSNNHLDSTVAPLVAKEIQYIDYELVQDNNAYTLDGKFANTQQQALLEETLSHAGKKLVINHTSTNETLQGQPAVALTNKILPHFAKHYSDGKIAYHNQKLTISGTADSYDAQHEMQNLLNSTTLASSDDSNVQVATLPIEYAIHKNNETIQAEGIFKDTTQINQIKSHLPGNTTSSFQVKGNHSDTGSLSIVEKFLPAFFSKYTKGDIIYTEEKLTITGNVHSQKELDEVNALLAHAAIPVRNQTIVDPQETEKQARLNALSAEKKAQQEAAKKAALEAAQKARDAEREAEHQAQANAAVKAEMQTKIANLFKLENIEFNVNKSTLTTKGQDTVNKLAGILKEYPSVKIEIAGHTDADGSAAYNQKLSQSRVDRVKTKLMAQAINSNRLTAKGYGETKPLVPNTSRANKAKNRRVEINILGE